MFRRALFHHAARHEFSRARMRTALRSNYGREINEDATALTEEIGILHKQIAAAIKKVEGK